MSEIENELCSNEKVLCQVTRHWIVALVPALFAAVLLVFGVLLAKSCLQISDEEGRTGALLAPVVYVLLSALLFAVAVRLRGSTHLAVTNLRVLIFIGVIYRRTLVTPLTSIEDVRIEQGELGKMLGYSNITIQSRSYFPLVLGRIRDGDRFRRQVLLLTNDLKRPLEMPKETFGIMQSITRVVYEDALPQVTTEIIETRQRVGVGSV